MEIFFKIPKSVWPFFREIRGFLPIAILNSPQIGARSAPYPMRCPIGELPRDNGRAEWSIRIRLEKKYAVKGGRLSKTIFKVESLLNVKPLITLRDGEIRPAALARTRIKGIDRLREFISSALHIDDLAIVYSTTPNEAQTLAEYARSLFPNIVPRMARLGPALGVHAGPGALVTVIRESMNPAKIFDLSRVVLSHRHTS